MPESKKSSSGAGFPSETANKPDRPLGHSGGSAPMDNPTLPKEDTLPTLTPGSLK